MVRQVGHCPLAKYTLEYGAQQIAIMVTTLMWNLKPLASSSFHGRPVGGLNCVRSIVFHCVSLRSPIAPLLHCPPLLISPLLRCPIARLPIFFHDGLYGAHPSKDQTSLSAG